MEKPQKHLDALTKGAVAQATEKMLKNDTAREIVVEELAAHPKALAAVLQKALARGKLAEFLTTLSSEQKKQIRRVLG